jgi:hypothetical protein
MPLSFVTVPVADHDWREIRINLADCVKHASDPTGAKGVRIYPHWIYEIDFNTMLGKVTASMRASSGTSINRVHCWTIGIGSASYEVNESGMPDIIGAGNRQWRWQLGIDIWGFFEHEGSAAEQQAAENEARLVSATLWRNAEVLQSGGIGISTITPLMFSNLGPSPFAGGEKVIVASGRLNVFTREALAS